MITNLTDIAIQEIRDTLPSRNAQAIAAVHAGAFDQTDWQAMWRQRGVRLERLADELEEITRQRDQLARRCAEQAHHIAQLHTTIMARDNEIDSMAQPSHHNEANPVADAIAAMQNTGIR